ncbi:uncharacterized protein EI90DRAFT_3139032 [Cantharellus anzutake]|uniref:uncharacterized protein n=1 Tax=Cantharellus anzutake TaxID=1750568 RepID=UPI00190625BB|nr:uncharacterized protein EI90DRAFT_3139032 [Cantharellus anzutake]KAF8310912.1 hypothetical protein EI90DRAFT_3139032 [Cantharellus anzutake]
MEVAKGEDAEIQAGAEKEGVVRWESVGSGFWDMTQSQQEKQEPHSVLVYWFEENLEQIIRDINTLTLETTDKPDLTGTSGDEELENSVEPTRPTHNDDRMALEATIESVGDSNEYVEEAVEGFVVEEEPAEDIMEIASKLLKQVTKVPTQQTLKNIIVRDQVQGKQ